MAIVAAGGAIATSLPGPDRLEWAPHATAFGFAALGVGFTHLRQPRPIDELRSTVIPALVLVPFVASAVWGILALLA